MPLTELLSAGKDGKSYYHRLDSHWNNMGAAVAAEALASKLNISIYPWTQESYSIVKNHKGDLYEMLYPAGKRLDENIEFHRKFSFRYLFRTETDPVIPSSEEKTEAEINGTDYYSENRPPEDNIKIETVSGEDTGNLLMFRDSFGNALYPFMADTFSYSAFSRLIPYRMDWLDEGEFDYIVVEIVERNLKNLASKAPVMPAPIISSYNDISEDSGETEKGGSDQTERITVAGNGKNHVRNRSLSFLLKCRDIA